MSGRITRRRFVRQSTGMSAGALLVGPTSLLGESTTLTGRRQNVATPFIATSHSNDTGAAGVEAGWEILARGGSALDAVERATNIIEEDPEDTSVGYGGLPNEMGVEGPACAMRTWLGEHACPGCGLTRGVSLAAHGRWELAWAVHPASPLVLVLALGGLLVHGHIVMGGGRGAGHEIALRAGRVLFVAGVIAGYVLKLV